jgi:hypothetical protein
MIPEQLRPRAVGGCLGQFVALPGKDERTALLGLAAQRLREGGLANARLTTDEDEAALPSDGGTETLTQHGTFALAPDEQWRTPCSGVL